MSLTERAYIGTFNLQIVRINRITYGDYRCSIGIYPAIPCSGNDFGNERNDILNTADSYMNFHKFDTISIDKVDSALLKMAEIEQNTTGGFP